jgi:hypothetical protein
LGFPVDVAYEGAKEIQQRGSDVPHQVALFFCEYDDELFCYFRVQPVEDGPRYYFCKMSSLANHLKLIDGVRQKSTYMNWLMLDGHDVSAIINAAQAKAMSSETRNTYMPKGDRDEPIDDEMDGTAGARVAEASGSEGSEQANGANEVCTSIVALICTGLRKAQFHNCLP